MVGKTPMNPSAASRIQSSQAKAGNPTGKNTFSARTQSSAATNANKGAAGGAQPATGKGPTTGTPAGAPKVPGGAKAKK